MDFSVGDRVHAPGLGTGVILEVRNHGRYLVEIKGRTVEVRAAQLTSASPTRNATRARQGGKGDAVSSGGSDASRLARGHAPMAIDLHGKTVDEAVEALEIFLNDALLAGHAEVRVIHGRSGGRIKAATHARLRVLTVVRAFRVDERNAGVTVVTL